MIQIVCCAMTPLQQGLYFHFLDSKAARAVAAGKQVKARSLPLASPALPLICARRRRCTTAGKAAGYKGRIARSGTERDHGPEEALQPPQADLRRPRQG